MVNRLCPEIEAEDRNWRFCGVWARNRQEWFTTLFAGMHFNITNVGFYDAMSIQAVDFILNQTKLTTIVCEGALVKKIVDMKKKGLGKSLSNLVLLDPVENDIQTSADAAGLKLFNYSTLLADGEGKETDYPFRESKPEDVYIFSYTSGTTGD
jgi:long-subunit acyl-CoA synthetase (AMP-forming)